MQNPIPHHKRLFIVSGCLVIFLSTVGVYYIFFTTYGIYGKNPFIFTKGTQALTTPHLSNPDQIKIVDLDRLKKDSLVKKIVPQVKSIALPPKVSVTYYTTYRDIGTTFIALQNAQKNELTPLIMQMQAYLNLKKFESLPDLGTKIQGVNESQKIRVFTLTNDLNKLAIENEAVTDTTIKELTTDFISTGKSAVEDYRAYTLLIDKILSGNLSLGSITDAKSLSSDSVATITSFQNATKKLNDYILKTFVQEINANFATSSKKK
jgi:hypothetical protein